MEIEYQFLDSRGIWLHHARRFAFLENVANLVQKAMKGFMAYIVEESQLRFIVISH